MRYYINAFKNYANFQGRASRKEYWIFWLLNTFFVLLAMVLDTILGITFGGLPFGFIYLAYALIILIPGIAMAVRRLHDVDKNGTMLLLVFLPIIGAIWLVILLLKDGNAGENQFGQVPEPLYDEVDRKLSLDRLLVLIVSWLLISGLSFRIIEGINIDWYQDEGLRQFWESFQLLNGLCWAFIPISLGFFVKNRSLQIAVFVIGAILLSNGINDLYDSLAMMNY
jgi:uncharacterized membrane protein YhaH (DUF805 family)